MLVARMLDERLSGAIPDGSFAVFFGGTAPENITGEIKKFAPTHLIIIDALDAGGSPGDIKLISPDEIGGASFGTHGLPLKMVTDYLSNFLKCEMIIIGIHPKAIAFGSGVSAEVESSAKTVSDLIVKIMADL